MMLVTCAQGSDEWLQARAAVITASRFSEAISRIKKASGKRKVGDPTAESDKYAAELAIERISGKPYGKPVKAWTLERGHELESFARMRYEARFGVLVDEVGLALTEDRLFGYSSDGFVGDDGLIEIKAPTDGLKIAAMLQDGDIAEYKHQMQGGLWITGRAWCDFIQFVPDLESAGTELYVQRIWRDDHFIDDMVLKLQAFAERVASYEVLFRFGKAA